MAVKTKAAMAFIKINMPCTSKFDPREIAHEVLQQARSGAGRFQPKTYRRQEPFVGQ